jgi:hypothetical protein
MGTAKGNGVGIKRFSSSHWPRLLSLFRPAITRSSSATS